MFNYLLPNETPRPEVILKRMSELGKCLLTGAEVDLTIIPVDLDAGNILASNMVCIQSKIAQEITYTQQYTYQGQHFQVTFDTPPHFEQYNKTLFDFEIDQIAKDSRLVDVFKYLTTRHLKGIYKISDGFRTLDRYHFQGFVFRILDMQAKCSFSIV